MIPQQGKVCSKLLLYPLSEKELRRNIEWTIQIHPSTSLEIEKPYVGFDNELSTWYDEISD